MPLLPKAPLLRAPARRSGRGQSLVEAAITLPVVLLLALGVIDIGRAFFYREAVTNGVRQALRVAVSPTQQATANAVCASAGAGPVAVTVTASPISTGAASIATIANLTALESSSTGTAAGSAIASGSLAVTFHCLAGVAVTNATSNGGLPSSPGSDSVTASITYTFPVITPLLWPVIGSTFPLTFSSSQRSEY
jgi:Flp pilus assembly protein TadG